MFFLLITDEDIDMDFEFKEKYDINDLIRIMNILRSPDGCPWDKEQTHKSIRSNFIEETYEAIEAIDTDNTNLLKEELGDVLLQVVFHSKIEEELGTFDFSDVADGICKKLIVRHPHIFSDLELSTSDEVLENWDRIKMKTKSQSSQSEAMNSISRSLPTLMRSKKVQQKASKIGFDFRDVKEAMGKISEEYGELKEAIDNETTEEIFDELGDLLFSVVNVSRILKIDPDYALSKSCDKFIRRFVKVEEIIKEKELDISNISYQELDYIWYESKKV